MIEVFLTFYCNADWQDALRKAQLSTFDQLWDCPIAWIEEPNQNRGGWSGVGCMEVTFNNKPVTLFIKKQLNHTKRSLRHPILGEPTFASEFHAIRFLQWHGMGVPNLVFFGQRSVKEGQQSLLVTEVLAGYQSLDKLDKSNLSLLEQRELLRCIAVSIKKMHQLGVQHRALYAKHIFVKPDAKTFSVALIDLEKSRRMVLPWLQASADLVTLNYRTLGWSNSARYFFYQQYVGHRPLSIYNRIRCWWIAAKSAKKRSF